MKYGRYEIIDELGRGSMGIVYKAHDPQIDRTIALKVLREDRVTSEDFVRRFLKEAMAVGKLSHPGIVTVYDVGQDHNSIFIAMEFLQGTPLDELMATKKFAQKEIIDLAIQTTQALHYAHQNGIIHRDIKPPNIIYSPEGSIRITDFGIARIEDPNGHQLTQVGEILGTPLYMSPEQIMGQPVDGRSDLYSLGVILYQLTTGKRPLEGTTLASIFRAITQDTPEAPHLLDPNIPEPLSALIMGLLAKEPAKRYSNGEDLIEAFRNCLVPIPSEKTESHPVPEPSPKASQGGKKFLYLGLGALIICAGIGSFWALQHRAAPPVLPTDGGSTSSLLPNSSSQIVPVVIDPNKLIREGTALSVIISSLPKKELMLKRARELGEISPRYMEDVKIAEETFASSLKNQEKNLNIFFDEITTWNHDFSPEQIHDAMEQINKGHLSERQKKVMALSAGLLKSLQNGATLTPEIVLKEFSQRFTDFVD